MNPAWILWMAAVPAPTATGPLVDCKAPEATRVHLRSSGARAGDEGTVALLAGSARFALELRDERTGAVLWTAGATPGALREVPAMGWPVLARPRPVDLDGDGFDDRVYLADTGGRLWRLDINADTSPDRMIDVSLLADLSGDGLRGFLAAPDVALQAGPNHSPWLSIALGSVSHAGQPASNRFYVLGDEAIVSRAGLDTPSRPPLRDADLSLSEGATSAARIDALGQGLLPDGYYLALGSSQVLAPSLTINGVVVFTATAPHSPQAGGCASLSAPAAMRIDVQAVAAADGRPALDLNGDGTLDRSDAVLELGDTHRADAGVRITAPDEGQPHGILPCLVDSEPVPGCQLDTRLRRRYWLREDAD